MFTVKVSPISVYVCEYIFCVIMVTNFLLYMLWTIALLLQRRTVCQSTEHLALSHLNQCP